MARRWLVVGAAVAAALLAAGCGGDDDDDDAAEGDTAETTSVEDSGADDSGSESGDAVDEGSETEGADGDAVVDETTAPPEEETGTESEQGEDASTGSGDAAFDFAADWPEERLCGLLTTAEAADILSLDEADVTLSYNDAFIDLGVQCHYASPEFDVVIVEVNTFTWEETQAIAEGLGSENGGEITEVAGHDAVIQENDIIGALISLDIGDDQPTLVVSAPTRDQATTAAELVLGRL
jgi:hypothetical protein